MGGRVFQIKYNKKRSDKVKWAGSRVKSQDNVVVLMLGNVVEPLQQLK